VITVVDPAMLKKLAGRGMPFYDKQLELADVLAINKCDLAGAELLDWAEQELRSRNAAAAIVRTEHGRISETLLDAPSRLAGLGSRVPAQTVAKSDSEKSGTRDLGSGTSKGRLRAFGLDLSDQTYTLDAVRAAFTELCATPPAGVFVHRAKGLFQTDQGTYLVEIAGEAVHVREAKTCAPRVDFVVELATQAELKSFEAAVREQLAACRMAALTDR
jgi:G3E family GTPase